MRVICLLAVVLIQGCVVPATSRLNVGVPSNANFKGPLSQVATMKFDVQALSDERSDKVRIGSKKNGFGGHTADVLSTRPVTDVVTEAIRKGLQQNGHVIALPGDIVVSGSVTRFWFEIKANFASFEYTGNVECDLRFVKAGTAQEVYRSRYSGTYSRKAAGGLDATYTEVMEASLGKLVEDIVFDANLVDSLNEPL